MKRAIEQAEQLICPLCNETLTHGDKRFVCPNNHSFDVAKQGYVNLLPVQHKRSKAPGDDKRMVLSRKAFLSAGYYQTLADHINSAIQQYVQTQSPAGITFLDAGCGEGYYSEQCLQHLQQVLPSINSAFIGIDISKPAILEACKRSKEIIWLVASLKDIPLPKQSVDIILSVFSPIQSAAFQQQLKKEGLLVVVTPGSNHLGSLKAILYDEVQPFDEDKPIALLESDWQLLDKQKINYPFQLHCQEDIHALLAMTPHTWRISPDRKARLNTLNELCCEADFVMTLWKLKK